MNSKNTGPVLLFKTIFRHWGCVIPFVDTDGKDRHGLENLKLRREISKSAVFWSTQTPDDESLFSISVLGCGLQEFNPRRIRLHVTN